MAHSFSPAKRALALALALHRRGYAVASDASPSMRGGLDSISAMEKGVTKNSSGPSGVSSVWAPDPIRGYYRPINQTNEIDPVELRKMPLKHKVRSSPSS